VATEAWLKSFLSTQGGVAGTVHLLQGVLTLESSGDARPVAKAVDAQACEEAATSLPEMG
jgi:hypothetical protein